MTDSPRSGSRSPQRSRSGSRSPAKEASRSRSRSASRSRSRSPAARRSRSPVARRSRSRSPRGGDPNNGSNLYVNGLTMQVTERELEDHFARYGKISKVQILRDPRTRESRGFGFVTMENADDAEDAIRNLHRSELDGKTINVEQAKRGRGRSPTPGRYMGPRRRDRYDPYRRDRRRSPYGRRRSRSPYYSRRSRSPYGRRSRSPYYSRRSRSPYDRRRSRSPYDRRSRSPRRY